MMVDLMHAMVATPFKKLQELNEVETQLLLTAAKKGSKLAPFFPLHGTHAARAIANLLTSR